MAAADRTSRLGGLRSVVVPLAVGAVTVIAYLSFLAWDDEYYTRSDGSQGGPFDTWQVAGLVVVVVAAVAVGAVLGDAVGSVAMATVALTVAWSWDAQTYGEEPSLWPVGAFMLFWGAALGLAFVAFVSVAARDAWRRTHRSPVGDGS